MSPIIHEQLCPKVKNFKLECTCPPEIDLSGKTDRELLFMAREYLDDFDDAHLSGLQADKLQILIDEIQARDEVDQSLHHFG